MAIPRHKRDTATFDALSFSEQAKSISAQVANLERAIRRHAQHPRATARTCTARLAQVQRLHQRLARVLAG